MRYVVFTQAVIEIDCEGQIEAVQYDEHNVYDDEEQLQSGSVDEFQYGSNDEYDDVKQ